ATNDPGCAPHFEQDDGAKSATTSSFFVSSMAVPPSSTSLGPPASPHSTFWTAAVRPLVSGARSLPSSATAATRRHRSPSPRIGFTHFGLSNRWSRQTLTISPPFPRNSSGKCAATPPQIGTENAGFGSVGSYVTTTPSSVRPPRIELPSTASALPSTS